MNVNEFKLKYGIESINIFEVDGHLYTDLLKVKLDINKNITLNEIKEPGNITVLPYHEGFVFSKDGDISPYGLKLPGIWTDGYALDLHTISSSATGIDPNGRTIWDTKRPTIAEELYRLKYRREQVHVEIIARYAFDFLNNFKTKWQLDLIIPIPPSDTTRTFQPVYEMANAIGRLTNLAVDFNSIKKIKSTAQLKEMESSPERKEMLKDAFSINDSFLSGKNILIFDDLYRSGETLNAVCDIIIKTGKVKNVYVLTITKTRSKR